MPARSRLSVPIRAIGVFILWCAVGAAVMLLLLATGGEYHRLRVMTVLSGSMVPTLEVGDLVVVQIVSPAELRAGEITTFRDPDHDRYVSHRVQSIVWRGEFADVVTRGDANEAPEQWTVRRDGQLGLIVLRIPRLGFALGALNTDAGRIGLGGAGLVLAGWAVHLIWRPTADASATEHAPAAPPDPGRHRAGARASRRRPVPGGRSAR